MGFLAKAFSNPEFLKYMDKYANREQEHIEVGRKIRLTMAPSIENLENIDSFLTTPIEDKSSSDVGKQDVSSLLEDDSNLWEELLNIEKNPKDVLEDLDTQQLDWDDDLKELVDQMKYLSHNENKMESGSDGGAGFEGSRDENGGGGDGNGGMNHPFPNPSFLL
ncbi:hypothetical protein L2E82_01033 [Cichorium intybus]|uniref:Uncharacterized protein n=1 Tax=Cichorium intybus TaxID=13427 RepID=A0ACB9GXG9_CICIN|nr:hypothetical protein L2E82_01033 [Cichorium intybus]